MAAKKDDGRKIVAENRKARFEYFITDTWEAGIMLTGTEVKSLRKGQANIAESYASVEDDGLLLINAYIPEYQLAGPFFQHAPRRPRKLLLHKREIHKLTHRDRTSGHDAWCRWSSISTSAAWPSSSSALAQGKKLHDKRETREEARLEPREGPHHAREGVSGMIDRELLMRIERAGVEAWPALETAAFDGWLWRFSDGGSQRANSVSALDYDGLNVEASIDEAERRYRVCDAPPMFQVSDVSQPPDLDQRLAARGYRINDPCTTLVKACTETVAPDGIVYLERATPEWFDCYSSVITDSRKRTAPRILAGVPSHGVFCGYRLDGRIVATALGVPREDVIIAECVATYAELRGKGAASQVMRGLEAWGRARGCRHVALQAVATNAPAQGLYRNLGYREHGRYHLRVKD